VCFSDFCLKGFEPNSQGRRVWSLARTNLNIKVKRQGQQGHKMNSALPSPPAPTERTVLAANDVTQQRRAPFRRCRGGGDFAAFLQRSCLCLVKHFSSRPDYLFVYTISPRTLSLSLPRSLRQIPNLFPTCLRIPQLSGFLAFLIGPNPGGRSS